jgi:iron complex transport system permease protein
MAGIIGFIGIMVPHMMRLVFGSDHRLLLPVAALFGASFLVIADTLARLVLAPAELPVGVITALCGAPYFIFLLKRKSL